MPRVTTRPERGRETRELILAAAERLFAEHGIEAVSNRQISEFAGQSNNYAVGYHFGTKEDLVREILRKHNAATEQRRIRMLDEVAGSADLRAWVGCLVRPSTDHLAGLPAPTWYARFLAQVDTEPGLRRLAVEEARASASIGHTAENVFRLVPEMPPQVRRDRADMWRLLVVHMLAERERALHEDTAADPAAVWQSTAHNLIDAIVALLLAPITPGR